MNSVRHGLLWLVLLTAVAAMAQPAPARARQSYLAATRRRAEQSAHPSPASEARPQRPEGAASKFEAVAPRPEIFTATAEREGRTAPLTLIINSYSTDADKAGMAAALHKGGQSELFRVLNSMHRGRMAFHGNVGREVNYIRSRTTPQGRTLLLISARILSFFELSRGERSRDYPFSVIRLTLDRNGNGTGAMVPAAKLHFTENNEIRVESYDQIPVRLMSVRTR